MATQTWSPGKAGLWSSNGNWHTGVPATGDDAVFSQPGTAPYIATFDPLTATLTNLTISTANATLAFKGGTELTVTALTNVTAGTIDVLNPATFFTDNLTLGSGTIDVGAGGHLEVSSGSIAAGGLIETTAGTGVVAGEFSGNGTVEAAGGNLVLSEDIGTSTLNFQVSNNALSLLQMDGTVAAANTFTFVPGGTTTPAGEVLFNNAATVDAFVNGMNVGTSNTLATNSVGLDGDFTIVGSNAESGNDATVTLSALVNGGTVTDTLHLNGVIGNTGSTWFVNTTTVGAITDVFLSTVVCYARGTMLRTPDGELPIEKLRAGKQVITLVDGQEVPRTVTWLGHRRINIVGHPRPETVAPVRIRRDAFAESMPYRDLIVSPDHAIFVDGKLICARQLVNGSTIRQESDWTAVDYYHVELDEHAILLAEGLPAESYIDTGNSRFFQNSEAPLVLHPDLTDETDYPTREAASCAPFVWDEASVRPVWQHLADRAGVIWQPAPQRATTTDADLQLRAKSRTVKPIYGDDRLAIFVLPLGAQEARLLSRAQSPTHARPWLDDRRKLGVRVKRIVLRGANELREIPMDHPDLTKGWWDIERDGQLMSRWTDGDAVVPLPKMDGHLMLEVHLDGEMTYAVEAALESQAERHAA